MMAQLSTQNIYPLSLIGRLMPAKFGSRTVDPGLETDIGCPIGLWMRRCRSECDCCGQRSDSLAVLGCWWHRDIRLRRLQGIPMTDLWLLHYERAYEEFCADRQVIGDANAITEFMHKMRKLGFDQLEMVDRISEAMS